MKNQLYSLILIVATLSVGSCKEESQTPKQNETKIEKGITLTIIPTWEGVKMETGKMQYSKPDGEILQLRTWGMILSKLALVKNDNSIEMLGDGYQWIDVSSGRLTFNYPDVSIGNYKGIQFQLGPDPAVNHGDPTVWPASHPLNGNLTGLHWGWSGGYVFQAFDGEFKDNASATAIKGFSFHTAGNVFNQLFFMPFTFELTGTHKTAILEFKADEYFKNPTELHLKDKAVSHSTGSEEITLMSKLLGNAADAFSVDSVK
jgi:hypothetical protein